jgi:hypothetical protein
MQELSASPTQEIHIMKNGDREEASSTVEYMPAKTGQCLRIHQKNSRLADLWAKSLLPSEMKMAMSSYSQSFAGNTLCCQSTGNWALVQYIMMLWHTAPSSG